MTSLAREHDDHYRTAALVQPLADWRNRARCAGRPGVMAAANTAQAFALCRACPVLAECTAAVLALPEALDPGGPYAGMTAAERRQARAEAAAGEDRRTCNTCHVTKPLAAYRPKVAPRTGLRTECEPCVARRNARPSEVTP